MVKNSLKKVQEDVYNMVIVLKALRCRVCANRFISKNCLHLPTHGKYLKYKSIGFHSTWEANFAKWCDGSGIKWEYEPKAFKLKLNKKETRYYPDFYLPEFDCWIEIKGYWHKDAKEKFQLFKRKYKNIYIIVLERDKLKEMGII